MRRTTSLAGSFASLLESQVLSDITFVVQGFHFKAHRAILATRSEYFDAMFSGGFMESKKDEFEVLDVSSEVFENLLIYIYTNQE